MIRSTRTLHFLWHQPHINVVQCSRRRQRLICESLVLPISNAKVIKWWESQHQVMFVLLFRNLYSTLNAAHSSVIPRQRLWVAVFLTRSGSIRSCWLCSIARRSNWGVAKTQLCNSLPWPDPPFLSWGHNTFDTSEKMLKLIFSSLPFQSSRRWIHQSRRFNFHCRPWMEKDDYFARCRHRHGRF